MAAAQYPGAGAVSIAALHAESLAAHLHKCDALWMAGDVERYARHLGYAIARLKDLEALSAAVAADRSADARVAP